jgi:methionyl-tRNA formyltransferase
MVNKENIVFMGSPAYAVPILIPLNEHYKICGVITQPDQPAGRGKILQAPAVKVYAETQSLPIFQPAKIRGADFLDLLTQLVPDVIVVAAYGKILPKAVLNFPKLGCINVHASLLPRWRGASPIHSAILQGDRKTGVTIMLMDEGIDTGPMLASKELILTGEETSGSLTDNLAELGADLLNQILPGYFDGSIKSVNQPEEGATYSQLLKKEDGKLDFSQDAAYLERQVRACNPWPGAFLEWDGNPLRVWKTKVVNSFNLESGKRGVSEKYPVVGTTDGALQLLEVQPAGKRAMRGTDFLNGARGWMK